MCSINVLEVLSKYTFLKLNQSSLQVGVLYRQLPGQMCLLSQETPPPH